MQHRPKYAFISILLAAILILEPALSAMSLQQAFAPWLGVAKTPSVYAQENDTNIYLPIISAGGTAAPTPTPTPTPTRTPTSAPVFAIMTPVEGSHIGGTTFFAIQPLTAQTITSVNFKAGNTDLGTDSTAADGFRVFVDVKTLPAGSLQFSATANGPGGSTTKTVTVNVVPNPPTTATIGGAGGVLASEIGSVISIRPGSVPEGTTITVDELTQAETTARHGIEWERMGVTFLGAQDVQSSAPISGPFGMVSSAGFGNRVQPGQAVVNYRLAPDADGDGVDEIVVVNTASVAPNGDVVADPIPQPVIKGSEPTLFASNSDLQFKSLEAIKGPPGKIIQVEVSGFNPYSMFGSTAIFRSLVDNTKVEYTGRIVKGLEDPNANDQIFVTVIPYLSAGLALMSLRNESNGFTTEPIEIMIEAPTSLAKPASAVINEFLDVWPQIFSDVEDKVDTSSWPVEWKQLISNRELSLVKEIADFRSWLNQLDTSNTATKEFLVRFATIIENSGVLSTRVEKFRDKQWIAKEDEGPFDAINAGAAVTGAGVGVAVGSSGVAGALSATLGLSGAAAAAATTWLALGLLALGGGLLLGGLGALALGLTGMGAAPPPGGNGGGNAVGSGGSKVTSASGQQTSPVMVKIFSNGNRTPFTGMTDPGGYFFVPLIPADEPFTALAIDTATGETRTFKGTGPATGESVFMFFDFYNDDGSGAQRIQIGDVITGEISVAGEIDLYSFVVSAGQQVYFDAQASSDGSNTSWSVVDSVGEVVFSLNRLGDSGPHVSTRGGTYTLSVNGRNDRTSTYRFQLWNVPPPDEFTIAIGDVISNGVPGTGAGNIETPGVEDVYTFTAQAGQRVYFDDQASSVSGNVTWRAVDSAGDAVVSFSQFSDSGPYVLSRGGTYTLTVDGNLDSTGTYRFQLWNVPPPQQFAIAIGDVISNSVPGPGAGNIETPGVEDVYTFTAQAGQRVYFDDQASSVSGNVTWRAVDSAGDAVVSFSQFSDSGPYVLSRGGTYTLTVDGNLDSTGTYRFQLWNVPPPQQFAIAIGDVISNSVPGPGAGNIETPGVEDVYTFTAQAGQSVYFDAQASSVSGGTSWRAVDSAGDVVFSFSQFRDSGPHVLSRGGTYTLTVDGNLDSTGTYRFQIIDDPDVARLRELVTEELE